MMENRVAEKKKAKKNPEFKINKKRQDETDTREGAESVYGEEGQ